MTSISYFTKQISKWVGPILQVSSLETLSLKKMKHCIVFSTQESEKHLITKFRTMIQYIIYLMTEIVLVETQVYYSFIFLLAS